MLHTGDLRGEEQNLVQGSSGPETTDEPDGHVHTQGEGHHSEHLGFPHHSLKNNANHKKGGVRGGQNKSMTK